ncbi:MAG: response regulator transcription factor [Chloroflexi bacterium]|nr:MAG: response regulator transcription factor [Chloroflexota bacterium]
MAMPRARILRGPGRVLVVSTDPALARFVQLTLNHGVYLTKAVGGTPVAIDAVALWKPHLVVVDIDRPDDDGLDLVRAREERRDRLPLIALTKRGDLEVPFVPVITVAGLKIDLLNQRVRSGSSTLRMTAMEQALLYFLASNRGETMTREQILDQLWGPDYLAESNLVDRHVRNLRAKLKDDWRRPRYIATVPGKGYRFIPAA